MITGRLKCCSNHRTLEVLLYKIALMLTAEVHAPTGDREFELMSVLDSLLRT